MGISIAFWIVGLLCILYFPVLCIDSRRWNPTFSGFWVGLGALFLLAGALCMRAGGVRETVLLVVCISGIFFLFVERKILLCTQHIPPEKLDYVIVLGARVNGNTPSAALMRRIRCAEQYLIQNPDTKIIVSGGQGPGEALSEAEAMKKVLMDAGIDRERILQEAKSTNTEENLRFSAKLYRCTEKKVGIVTSEFHMYRSLMLARDLGYTECYAIPAQSEVISLPNYLVREFFAVLKEYMIQEKRRGRK